MTTGAQLPCWQAPPKQLTWHAPQFFASLERSVSQPFAGSLSQSACVALHAPPVPPEAPVPPVPPVAPVRPVAPVPPVAAAPAAPATPPLPPLPPLPNTHPPGSVHSFGSISAGTQLPATH